MIKKVVIVHGYTGHPDKNWFPWLKQKLEANGLEVIVPEMPDPDHPKLGDWLGCLNDLNLGAPEERIMVGHSLGCATILRHVEQFNPGQKLAAAILVAGFAAPLSIPEISNLVTGSWNDAKIRESIKKIAYYNSDNDPYVPMEKAESMQKRFGGELHKVHNAGHFNWRDGFTGLPVVYEKIMELVKS